MAFNGSDYSRGNVERPLIRVFIHNNFVKDSLLGMQDYGGIESWMAGPSYVYNNISINPVGYKHSDFKKLAKKNWYRTSCFGIGIYFDGQYKGYAFNNLMVGKNNNVNDRIYNSCAFKEAMGFSNTVFNNTMYNFGVGMHKDMIQHNRCNYLGNVMIDMGLNFIQHNPKPDIIDYKSIAYKNNYFSGNPFYFGEIGFKKVGKIEIWKKILNSKKVIESQTGQIITRSDDESYLNNGIGSSGDSIIKKSKVFVPWGLYGVVGEWNFFDHASDSAIIQGEDIYFSSEWHHREMFQDIPQNNLKAVNIDRSNYKSGILDGWVKGALWLNGKNQYCLLSDSEVKKSYDWKDGYGRSSGSYDGKNRKTVDVGLNNFLIEAVLKTDQKKKSYVVSKTNKKGYSLFLEDNGYIKLILRFGEKQCSRDSSIVINDNMWHHVIVQADRSKDEGIDIFIDGELANGKWTGLMNNSISLSNKADFNVGKLSNNKDGFYKGFIDYLRISRGTLKDAETDIEELYKWEFHGHFLNLL